MIIYACSTNLGKLAEFRLAAQESGAPDLIIEPLPGLRQIPAPDEHGATFEENAIAKAIYYSGFTREIVLADDSGLSVEALDGAPGVHSARYAGANSSDDANNALLLDVLRNCNSRTAAFVCVIALARAGVILATAQGRDLGRDPRPHREAGTGSVTILCFSIRLSAVPSRNSHLKKSSPSATAVKPFAHCLRAFAKITNETGRKLAGLSTDASQPAS